MNKTVRVAAHCAATFNWVPLSAAIFVAVYFAQAPGDGAGEELGLGAAPKPEVSVIEPELTDWTQQVDLTAVVSLARKARVVSEVSSRVVWISPKFSNGGSIPARETMIRIDPRDFELRVEAARASVKEAEASVWRQQARGEHDARVFRTGTTQGWKCRSGFVAFPPLPRSRPNWSGRRWR